MIFHRCSENPESNPQNSISSFQPPSNEMNVMCMFLLSYFQEGYFNFPEENEVILQKNKLSGMDQT
jgi:hypothetical protein